jgi:DNA invertase Pin-like site-specific DNA recombinase
VKRQWRRITSEKRRQIIKLAAQGATYREIADAVDLSNGAVGIVLQPLGGDPSGDVGSRRSAAVAGRAG